MKPSRKLADEWRRRLKASGFEDLEVGTGELLSRRGFTVGKTEEDAAGREAEVAYYDQAQVILRRLTDPADRKVWKLHAARIGMHRIAASTGLTYHAVRETVARISTSQAERRASSESRGTQCKHSIDAKRAIRRSQPRILALLGAAILRSAIQTRRRYSASAW